MKKSIIEKLKHQEGNCISECRHFGSAVENGDCCFIHEEKPERCNDIDTINRDPQIYDVMLEALIEEVDAQEELACGEQIDMAYEKMKDIIQKATGKTWEEIKDLLNE